MIKKSTGLFPERKDFKKINDAAVGWASRKRKTNPRIDLLDSMRMSGINGTNSSYHAMDSPRTISQKKAVRLMLNEPDGSVSIEPASPAVSAREKRILIKSPSSNREEAT